MSFFLSKTELLRKKIEARLAEYNRPSLGFFLLMILASSLATLGLALDNTAVVIGAMVVAPLVTPVFGFSLGIILLQVKKSIGYLIPVLTGSLLAVLISAITGYLIVFIENRPLLLTTEIISRAEPSFFYFLIAIISGVAGSYAYSKPKVISSITGIAISVALIPPLAVVGLGITMQNWILLEQSLFLFALNLTGIILGSIVTFLFLGLGGGE